MGLRRIAFTSLALFACFSGYAQLGFCSGSKGEPLFTENFGNGTTYGPPLPAGVTTYTYVTGAPNDGQYTLASNSYQYTTWHNSPDHTSDATNGPNGKMLLMNANAVTSGDFYKRTVTGLCVNTTFEFSAWIMNVYNPNTNYCGAGQIPINVEFVIMNASETATLGSGNTGNIYGSPAPLWQQFALVFTTGSETSVVLKMKNNGLGGCGNDLAIDDITFSACSDLTTISSPSVAGSTYSACTSPVSLQLSAATSSAIPYFYQWQSSTDNVTWADVPGATNPTYVTPNLTSQTYYRVKAAQDAANLSGAYCSGISNVFTVSFLSVPNAALSNGDVTICSDQPIPPLAVTAGAGTGVNWYDAATGGNLVQSNSLTYTPPVAGTYYAETFNTTSNCIGPRTPVKLTVVPLPDATISGSTSICSGNTAVINFSGTPNAIVTFTDGSTSHTIALNASGTGSFTTPVLASTTVYTMTNVASAVLGTCARSKNDAVTVTVNNTATASFTGNTTICSGGQVTLNFTGTHNATVTYTAGSASQTVTLDASGTATAVFPNITSTTVYTLISVNVGGFCTQPLSQSVTTSVVPSPTASVSASPATICSGQASTISFIGTPNAVVTYKINGGGNQTIPLDASGAATVMATGLTANTAYTLMGASLGTCSTALSNSVTVTVNNLPTASVSTNAPVCSGSSATINFSGTPNAVVHYTVSGSGTHTVTLDAGGNASVTEPNVTSALIFTLVDVTAAGPNGCTNALSQSVTVWTNPLPVVSIGANPSAVCQGQSGNINFTGTPNAVVTYTDGSANHTVNLGAAGTATVATNALSANATYQLVAVALGSCSQPASGSVTVTVNQVPDVSYSGNLVYCAGNPVAISLTSSVPAATFNWTIVQNGTTGATSGSGNQIAQNVGLTGNASGTVTYIVTPSYFGCSGNPLPITVTINPLPLPQITDGVICTTSSAAPGTQYYLLDTQLNPASDYSFQWFYGSGQIPGASGNTYNATQTGVYTVIATSSAGCTSLPVSATVGEMPQGESLVITHSAAFADDPKITVTVVGGGGPFYYQLDNGPLQTWGEFYNVPAGTHSITVIDDHCTHLTGSATIIDYPKFFTPNGDGFHDTWNITGVSDARIWIFDRYGKLLKQIRGGIDTEGWDGMYNGQALPSTDYWFVIDYTDGGSAKTFRAHFSLKR